MQGSERPSVCSKEEVPMLGPSVLRDYETYPQEISFPGYEQNIWFAQNPQDGLIKNCPFENDSGIESDLLLLISLLHVQGVQADRRGKNIGFPPSDVIRND